MKQRGLKILGIRKAKGWSLGNERGAEAEQEAEGSPTQGHGKAFGLVFMCDGKSLVSG